MTHVFRPLTTKYFRVYFWFHRPRFLFRMWREDNRVCVRFHIIFVSLHFGFGDYDLARLDPNEKHWLWNGEPVTWHEFMGRLKDLDGLEND